MMERAVFKREFVRQKRTSNNNNIQVTSFQRKVYDAVCCVPEGYVTTYRDLAKFIDCRSCQAVGQALKRNPFAPMVPCHRVIKSDRTIGGFHGALAGEIIDKKVQLLRNEGIIFSDDGKVELRCVYDYSHTK
jgi:methylated-DNA-[protein]-cysteine S-methyltransferase